MKLRLQDSAPDPKDPFKDDLLERGRLAERLTIFLSNVEGPFTMALTGPYGSGKSYFLRRCKILLEKAHVPVVLINAWETDFASEPLAPIISELAEKFSGQLTQGAQRWKKTKGLAAKVAAASVPIGVKLLSAGILEAEDFSGANTIGDAVEKIAEKQFERFAAAKKSVAGLKKELEGLAQQIREKQRSNKDKESEAHSPPVVVLIDELDRCRPNYSIDVLEVVKHFFEIPGIVFVLAVDRKQLLAAAEAVFGAGLDGDGYLRKFIDLECSLPEPKVENFCYNFMRTQAALFDWNLYSSLQQPIARLCDRAGLTLRQTQQFLIRASVAVAAGSTIAQPEPILFLVLLRQLDSDTYQNFLRGKLLAWEVLVRLREIDPEFGNPTNNGGVVFLEVLAGVGRDEPPKPFVELLEEDYKKKGLSTKAVDFLRMGTSGSYRAYLRQITPCVDFCATVVG